MPTATPIDATEHWSHVASIVSGLVSSAALIAAAVWFWRRRQTRPRAEVTDVVSVDRLPDGQLLVHVELRVKNIGEVLLELAEVRSRLLQVLPFTDTFRLALDAPSSRAPEQRTEFPWIEVTNWSLRYSSDGHPVVIEPGETDEIHFDAVIPGDITRLQVHSYVDNVIVKGRSVGWRRTSLHNIHLAGDGTKGELMNSTTQGDATGRSSTTQASGGPTEPRPAQPRPTPQPERPQRPPDQPRPSPRPSPESEPPTIPRQQPDKPSTPKRPK